MAHGLLAVGADGRLLDAPLRDVVLADVAEFLQLQAVAHTEVLGIQASGLEAAQVDTGMAAVAEVDEGVLHVACQAQREAGNGARHLLSVAELLLRVYIFRAFLKTAILAPQSDG